MTVGCDPRTPAFVWGGKSEPRRIPYRCWEAHCDLAADLRTELDEIETRSEKLLSEWQERHGDAFVDLLATLRAMLRDEAFVSRP